jgi:hypothetical protein
MTSLTPELPNAREINDRIDEIERLALFRLYAVTKFLLGTTALTQMPWAQRSRP